jgi:hypothetical protein
MATSGNTISLLTRDEIINAALRKLMVLSEGVSPSATQTTNAAQALNIIVAEFRTLGMSVWARSSYQLTIVPTQSAYVFGVGQAVNTPYPNYIYEIVYVPGPNFDTQIELNDMAIIDFNLLPLGSSGIPVNFNYQPGNNIGTLKVWPTPDTTVPTGSYLSITYQRPIEVFDASTDNPDFPQEWGNALIYRLALSLCDEYGVPDTKQARIEAQAEKHLATALSNSNEQGSLFFQPDYRYYS